MCLEVSKSLIALIDLAAYFFLFCLYNYVCNNLLLYYNNRVKQKETTIARKSGWRKKSNRSHHPHPPTKNLLNQSEYRV